MPLIAADTGKDFEPIPAGVYIAVCNLVCDLGEQLNKTYSKMQRKVYLRWEIPAVRIQWEDRSVNTTQEGPAQIGHTYTLSLSSKSLLYRDLTNWRGRPFTGEELKGFDLFKVLGAACQIQVVHEPDKQNPAKVRANISGIFGLPPGVARPKAEGILIKYSPDEPQQFSQLPGWLQTKLQQPAAAAQTAVNDPFNPASPHFVQRGPMPTVVAAPTPAAPRVNGGVQTAATYPPTMGRPLPQRQHEPEPPPMSAYEDDDLDNIDSDIPFAFPLGTFLPLLGAFGIGASLLHGAQGLL